MIARRGSGQRFSLARWSRRKLQAANAASAPAAAAPAGTPPAPPAVELPPVESLSFASDFTPFLRPEVDDQVRRAALKQLFRDPRFNIMDGLDTYIDDYTRADPIAPDVLADLLQRGFGALPDGRDGAADDAIASQPAAARRDIADSAPAVDGVAALPPAPSPGVVSSARACVPALPEEKAAEDEAKQGHSPEKAP